MVTVKVFAFKEDGMECEDFVIGDMLYPLGASECESDRRATALRCIRGSFFGLSAEDNMDENAVLITTYNFDEE